MSEKRPPQRVWESKLQAQQDDLDKREALVSSLEKKFAAMQIRAEDLQRREEAMKAREERCAELEFRSMKIVRNEDAAKVLRDSTKVEQERLARQQETLTSRTAEFEKDVACRENEIRSRLKELDNREEKLEKDRERFGIDCEEASKHFDEREHELQVLERDVKIRRVQLMEDHAQVQHSIMEMRNKEEEHEQFEKLLKDMQAMEEKSHRQLRLQEEDLIRQKGQLDTAREDHAAEVQSFSTLQKQLEIDQRQVEQATAQLKAEELSLQKKAAHLTIREHEIESRRKACEEELAKVESRRAELDAAIKKRDEDQVRTIQLQKCAEIDMKRAALLRERCGHDSRQNREVSRKLGEKEHDLQEWDEELDRREAEFTRAAETAMSLPKGQPTFAPAKVNQALNCVQMEHLKEQYLAGFKRRAVFAFGGKTRPSSSKSRAQSASSMRSSGTQAMDENQSSAPSRPHSSKSQVVVVGSVDVEDLEILSESRRAELRAVLAPLAKDFRYLIGKISRLQATVSTPEERELMMQKNFTPSERAVVESAVMRERDIGSEVALRNCIRRSPIAGVAVGADPMKVLAEMQVWWRDLVQHLSARDEDVLQERYDRLGDAVDILRRRVPQMAAVARKRADSAQPLYGAAQHGKTVYL